MIRLRFGPFGLDHDRDYGIDKRTGWCAHVRGCYPLDDRQFVGLLAALLDLWRRRNAGRG